MVEVIEKKEPHFRVQIYDLKAKKSRNITIANNEGLSVEDIKAYLVECLKKFNQNYKKAKI